MNQRKIRIEDELSYCIFRNQMRVSVRKELVDLYEKNVAPFHAKRAEYFAVSEGCDENSEKESVEKAIEAGIIEEVSVYSEKEHIVDLAGKKGYI